jgi:hypothetical protein
MTGTRISDMPTKAGLAAGDKIPVVSGGANYEFDIGTALGALNVGAFSTISTATIPINTTRIATSCYRSPVVPALPKGGAIYDYDPAVDAAFVAAHPGWSIMSLNGRGFRLSEGQRITFEMFGAYGDATDFSFANGTDDYPSWLKVKDFLDTLKEVHGNSYYKAVPAIHFGRHIYRFSQYLDLTDGSYELTGSGPAALDRAGNTVLLFKNTCGIICQSWDTTGVTGTTTNTPKGSAGSRIADLVFYSAGGTLGAEEHGALVKAPVTLERCGFINFGGDGICWAADVTHAGNANCGKIINCWGIQNGRNGLTMIGGDANACEVPGFNAIANAHWGICQQSFLGDHHFGGHTSGNGTTSAGPDWRPASYTGQVQHGGHYYRVVPGQALGAKSNAPSGAATDNTWWLYYGDGAATALFPAWVSGTTYVEGGAMLIDGASNKSGVCFIYMESDQTIGLSTSANATMICGGFGAFMGVGNIIAANDSRGWFPNGIGTTANHIDGVNVSKLKVAFVEERFFVYDSVTGNVSFQGNSGGTTNMILGGAAGGYGATFPTGLSATVPTYADNAAAAAGGLAVGKFYKTATGQAMVRY